MTQTANDILQTMDDVKQMFKAIINGQNALKEELLRKISAVERKLGGRIGSLEHKMDTMEKNLSARIDRLGFDLANLEDDAPTREEFDDLENRVTKLESTSPSH